MDLAFQKVQEFLLPGLSALCTLSGKLVSSIQSGNTPNTRETLTVIMDSIALLCNTHHKLNMKRRELIKPELNPPYTRLCKEEIKTTSKLFGDDPSKHLKDMAELKKVGIQMQKPSSTSTSFQDYKAPKQRFNRPHFAKPYARAHGQFATQKANSQRHLLAKGCPHQTTHSNPEGSMKDKVREKVTPIVNAELLSQLVLNFKAGCVKEHITNWKAVTTDPVILDAIRHHHIEFERHCRPVQATQPRQISFSSADKDIINLEIAKLLTKGVIEPSKPSDGDFISTIFV